MILSQCSRQCEESMRIARNSPFNKVGCSIRIVNPIRSVCDVEKCQSQLRIVWRGSTRLSKVLRCLYGIFGRIKHSEIVMSLEVGRIDLQHLLKLANRFRWFAMFRIPATQVVAGADELWVEQDRCCEFPESLIFFFRSIEDNTHDIMSNG